MLGEIIGDIVGSRFEFAIFDFKSKQSAFYHHKCEVTDDSIMTLAIANAILSCGDYGNYSNLAYQAVLYMRDMGRRYPKAGYGGRFRTWLQESNPRLCQKTTVRGAPKPRFFMLTQKNIRHCCRSYALTG